MTTVREATTAREATTTGRRPLRLSVLDLAGVGVGSSVGEALADTTRLAIRAEELGYHRFWVAEHHGMPAVASSAPAVLLAHLAANTRNIRVGSGGVMLPNHAPIVVAEQFGTLAALHPGRIDLGLGRAPGSDQLSAHALRRRMAGQGSDDFGDQLEELQHFMNGDFPADHPVLADPDHSGSPGSGVHPRLVRLRRQARGPARVCRLPSPITSPGPAATPTRPLISIARCSSRPRYSTSRIR